MQVLVVDNNNVMLSFINIFAVIFFVTLLVSVECTTATVCVICLLFHVFFDRKLFMLLSQILTAGILLISVEITSESIF